MRTAHFSAFDTRLKARVPALAALVFDGDVPLNPDGTVRRATYLVAHDMGFDEQADDRLTVSVLDTADGTYRIVVRVVAVTRSAVREVADIVKTQMTGQVLTVTGRACGALFLDPGPRPVERDTDVSPPIFYLDLDFLFRSTRA